MNPDITKQSKLHEVSNLIKTFAISRQKIAVKSNLVYTFDFTPTKVQHTARIYMYTRVNRSTLPDSSPVVSKLSLLINYLLGKDLGYAHGEDGKSRGGETLPSPFFLPVIPFVKEPVLVFHAKY